MVRLPFLHSLLQPPSFPARDVWLDPAAHVAFWERRVTMDAFSSALLASQLLDPKKSGVIRASKTGTWYRLVPISRSTLRVQVCLKDMGSSSKKNSYPCAQAPHRSDLSPRPPRPSPRLAWHDGLTLSFVLLKQKWMARCPRKRFSSNQGNSRHVACWREGNADVPGPVTKRPVTCRYERHKGHRYERFAIGRDSNGAPGRTTNGTRTLLGASRRVP